MTVSTATAPAAPTSPNKAAKLPPRRWITPAAIGAAVLIVVSTAGYLATATPDPNRTPGQAVPPSAEPQPQPHASADSPAAARLIAMADLIGMAPTDSQTGWFVYIETEHWSRRDGTEIVGFHDRIWHAPDGFTRISQRQLPGQAAGAFDLNQIGHTSFDAVEPVVSDYTADEGFSFVERHGAAPSSNPEQLTRQLDAESSGSRSQAACPPACGRMSAPNVFLDNVVGLHRSEYLDRDVRAAVLRIVAIVPGLTYGGEVTDRAGRPGIAVWLDSGGVRQTLIFNRATGEMLASERSVPGFVLDDYTLYLDRGRRDDVG